MLTVTGTLRSGNGSALASTSFQILERNQRLPGRLIHTGTTDGSGVFSFTMLPGSYYFRFEGTVLPFQVEQTSGTATLGSLVTP